MSLRRTHGAWCSARAATPTPVAMAQVRDHLKKQGVLDLQVFKQAVLGLLFGTGTPPHGWDEAREPPSMMWHPWATDDQILVDLIVAFGRQPRLQRPPSQPPVG